MKFKSIIFTLAIICQVFSFPPFRPPLVNITTRSIKDEDHIVSFTKRNQEAYEKRQNNKLNVLIFESRSTKYQSDEWYCSYTVGQFFEYTGQWNVYFAGYNQLNYALSQYGVNFNLYVQPGSNYDVSQFVQGFSSSDFSAMTSYVNNGGNYLGICMGAFLATKLGFSLLPGISYYNDKKGYENAQLVPTFWGNSQESQTYVEGGPQITGFSTVAGKSKIYSTFSDGSPNAAFMKVGKGMVGISSSHFEADNDWMNNLTPLYNYGYGFIGDILNHQV